MSQTNTASKVAARHQADLAHQAHASALAELLRRKATRARHALVQEAEDALTAAEVRLSYWTALAR
jgi:hypothetical protein